MEGSMKYLAGYAASLLLMWLVVGCSCGPNPKPEPEDLGGDQGEVSDLEALPDLDVPQAELPFEELKDTVELDQTRTEEPSIDVEVEPDETTLDQEVKPDLCLSPCKVKDDCLEIEGQTACWKPYCLLDEECEALDPELALQCELVKSPYPCCDEASDCKDESVCTINEKCVDNKCSFDYDLANPDCCLNTVLFGDDFEQYELGNVLGEGILGEYKVSESYGLPNDLIKATVQESPCGKGLAVYIGDAACQTYYNGQIIEGCQVVELIDCQIATEEEDCPPPLQKCNPGSLKCQPSPDSNRILLDIRREGLLPPADAFTSVTFRFWMDGEMPSGAGQPGDTLQLLAVSPENPDGQVLFDSAEEFVNTTEGACAFVAADLTQFAGKSIDLIWRFDTLDGNDNLFKGVYIDDVVVSTYCEKSVCKNLAACDDEDQCTDDYCAGFANKDDGQCINDLKYPYCIECAVEGECQGKGPHPDPGDWYCFPPKCEIPGGEQEGFCSWTPNPACCGPDDMDDFYSEGLEGGALPAGYEAVSSPGGSDVGWHVVAGKGAQEAGPDQDTYAFYFGDPAKWNYDCGQLLCFGSLTTSKIDLTKMSTKAFVKLSFFLQMSTEWDVADEYVPDAGIDELTVQAKEEGGEWKDVWSSDAVEGSTQGKYVPTWADLSEFGGKEVYLRFTFTTGEIDPSNNDYFGVLVDEITIETVCDKVCSLDTQCDPGTDCKEGVCSDGKCSTKPVPECCVSEMDLACDDKDPCTADGCNVPVKTCTHDWKQDPNCCTPKDGLFFDDFEDSSKFDFLQDKPETSTVWTIPKVDALHCGDSIPDEGEDCHNCPADMDQCAVSWHLASNEPFSGQQTLYFGDPDLWNYETTPGDIETWGEIYSPVYAIPQYGIPVLDFMLRLDTEYCANYGLYVEPDVNPWDVLSIKAQCSADGKEWAAEQLIWDSLAWDIRGCTWDQQQAQAVWKQVSVGMKKFVDGKCVGKKQLRFRLEFHSGDFFSNDYSGVFIDNMSVKTVCNAAYECSSAFECPEASPEDPHCTIEECVQGKCSSKLNPLKSGCVSFDKVASYDFDGPCSVEGWTTDTPGAKVKWQADGAQKHGGECALYFGNVETHLYADPGGQTPKGCTRSPAIKVTGKNNITLSYWTWMDIMDPQYYLDKLEVKINQAKNETGELLPGMTKVLWAKPCPTNDASCAPQPKDACLSLGCSDLPMKSWQINEIPVSIKGLNWVPLTDQWAVFEFCFNAGDNKGNNAAGVYVDDVLVKAPVP